LKKIQFEGQDLDINERTLNYGQGAFFDSGTTLMYTVQETYNKMMSGFNSFCNQPGKCGRRTSDNNCFMYDPSSEGVQAFLQNFPSFTFYFGDNEGLPYELRGEDYLYDQYPGSNKFCVGIEVFSDRTILGGTFMRNHDILFDKEKGILGFVRSNCSAVSYVSTPEVIPGIIDSIAKTNNNNNNSDNWAGTSQPDDNLMLWNALLVLAISGGLFGLYLCLRSKNTHTQIYDEEAPRVDDSRDMVNPSHFQIQDEGEEETDDKEAHSDTESTSQTFN
jgi:hypothetical protein